jgi:hypothetical protein
MTPTTTLIISNTQRLKNHISIGKRAIDTIIDEHFKNFSPEHTIKKVKSTTKFGILGRCSYNNWQKYFTISLCENYLYNIGNFYRNNLEKSFIPGNTLNVFQVLHHELYHTKNKMPISWIEEALTEINSNIYLSKFIDKISTKEYDTIAIQISYKNYINNLIYLFHTIGISEKDSFKIFKDLKNFNTVNYPKKHRDLLDIENIIDFLFFIDKYYKQESIKYFFGKDYNQIDSKLLLTKVIDKVKQSKDYMLLHDLFRIDFNKECYYKLSLYSENRDLSNLIFKYTVK